jgi:5-methylcytosine-specific restriction endonuclease McrA
MRLPGKLIKEIWTRDKNTCQDCGAEWKDEVNRPFWIHHIKPKAQGGANDQSNLKLLCYPCTIKYHPKIDNLYKRNVRVIRETCLGTVYERCY